MIDNPRIMSTKFKTQVPVAPLNEPWFNKNESKTKSKFQQGYMNIILNYATINATEKTFKCEKVILHFHQNRPHTQEATGSGYFHYFREQLAPNFK